MMERARRHALKNIPHENSQIWWDARAHYSLDWLRYNTLSRSAVRDDSTWSTSSCLFFTLFHFLVFLFLLFFHIWLLQFCEIIDGSVRVNIVFGRVAFSFNLLRWSEFFCSLRYMYFDRSFYLPYVFYNRNNINNTLQKSGKPH